jgi:hypothetical protein
MTGGVVRQMKTRALPGDILFFARRAVLQKEAVAILMGMW